jgi:mannose-6-phosphate isomerase-like protein (cupin superfamily)
VKLNTPELLDIAKTDGRRPWGYYEVLSDSPDHKVKRIVVRPGMRLSLQRHRHRSEHWTVIAGTPIVTLDGREITLNPGESAHIPVGAKHRLSNPGRDDVVLIEVQTGTYFGEDDIERFEDDFGRVDEDTSASKRTGNSSFRT